MEDVREYKLSKEEIRAIKALERVAEKWPKSLWLFSASGSLCVMKTDENGKRIFNERNGGVDQRAKVANIKIPNDGGDW